MYSGWFVFLLFIGAPVILWLGFWVLFAVAKIIKGRRQRGLSERSNGTHRSS